MSKPKFYKKTYNGFTRLFKVADDGIYSCCAYHDQNEITVIKYHRDSVEVNKEIADKEFCFEITETEFIDTVIMLKKLF